MSLQRAIEWEVQRVATPFTTEDAPGYTFQRWANLDRRIDVVRCVRDDGVEARVDVRDETMRRVGPATAITNAMSQAIQRIERPPAGEWIDRRVAALAGERPWR